MELLLSSFCLFNEYRCGNAQTHQQPSQKIKHRIKLLNHHLCHYSLVKLKWLNFECFKGLVFVFSHGVIFSICFDKNYSIISVAQENFLLNKLSSKRISSVDITEKFILISYVEPYLACISLENNFKPNKTYTKFKLKTSCSTKQISLEKYVNRFAKRNLTISEQYALVWWNRMPHRHNWSSTTTTTNEKNLIVFSFEDFSILETNPINGEILQADFIAKEPTKFGILHKQKCSAYNLTYLLFEISNCDNAGALTAVSKESSTLNASIMIKLVFEISIPMEKLCFSAEFTQTQDKILLLCDDESVMQFNIEQNVLYSLNSSIPICFMATYPLDSIFVTCDQHGQISIYDNAFNNILYVCKTIPGQQSVQHENVCTNSNMSIKRLQFLSPNILMTLMVENRRQDHSAKPSTNLLSTLRSSNRQSFNNICLKLIIFPYRITFKRLINEYLYLSKYEEALNVLRIINWNCSYEDAYLCLHTIFQHLIKLPFDQELDNHIESTLAAFLIPMTPIDYKIFEKILPYIRQLAIRFFYHLIRNGSFQKAYQLAIELKSPRLFLLLAQLFKMKGNDDLSAKAYEQARNLL